MAAGEFIKTDVEGTFVLLEAARRAGGLQRFVQISTDEVYGSVPSGASRETDELRPRNPYSASKAGADRLAFSYWATYEVPVIVTRASNNYGPYQFPEKVIPLFVTNAIDDIPVPLYGDGRNVRDWLHVLDHCRAIDLLIDKAASGEVYNIGGGNEVMNVDLTHQILEALGKPALLPRHGEAARARLVPTSAVRRRPARHHRVVQRERMVVAAYQGRRPAIQVVLSGAVRNPPLTRVDSRHRRRRVRRQPRRRSACRRRRHGWLDA